MEPDYQLPLIAEAAPLRIAAKPFCVFEVPGPPRGKRPPRTTINRHTNRLLIYPDPRTVEDQKEIALLAKMEMGTRPPSKQPCAVLVHAFFRIPDYWTMREKLDARNGATLPTVKPDGDNILKLICDALTGIVWVDDCAAVDQRVIKRYSVKTGMRVEVREYTVELQP